MFAVSVIFDAVTGRSEALQEALLEQANNSLREEAECLRFDVAADTEQEGRFFFYEVYTDEAAFEKHLQTPHYASFSKKTSDLVANKTVNRWTMLRGGA